MKFEINIEQFKLLNLLQESTKTARFVSLKGMETKNEIQDILINVGVDYSKMKKIDIKYLEELDVETLKTGNVDIDKELEKCRLELLHNLTKPNNYTKGQTNAYTILQKNVKVHNTTGEIVVYAQLISKKTIEIHTPYKKTNKRNKTKAKDIIKSNLKNSKYRQYKLSKLSSATLEGQTIQL